MDILWRDAYMSFCHSVSVNKHVMNIYMSWPDSLISSQPDEYSNKRTELPVVIQNSMTLCYNEDVIKLLA